MKLIFFGTPDFAAEILRDLVAQGHEVLAVVTRPDKPQGRSSQLLAPSVKVAAAEILPSATIYQPIKASDPEFQEQLKNHGAELFVVVAYGQILKQSLLDIPPYGCINIHASLLPKYRGAAPIQRCLMEGEKETGITIMQMSAGLDAGDILYQLKMPIPIEMNAKELFIELCGLAKVALGYVLDHFLEIKPIPQDPSKVTFAAKIELEDAKIDWNQSAESIHNLVRGVFPNPGAWCRILVKGQEKTLKIISSKFINDLNGVSGEMISFDKNAMIIACQTGALQLLFVQLEGKKVVSAKEFACGYKAPDLVFIKS